MDLLIQLTLITHSGGNLGLSKDKTFLNEREQQEHSVKRHFYRF